MRNEVQETFTQDVGGVSYEVQKKYGEVTHQELFRVHHEASWSPTVEAAVAVDKSMRNRSANYGGKKNL